MNLRTFVVTGCAVVTAVAVYAQSTADPMSGMWSGTMGPTAADQRTVTVEVKANGKTLSGTIVGQGLTPGDFTGTFDAATGAVKLEVVVRGNGGKATLEGKHDRGSIEGKVILPDQTGAFKISKLSGAEATAAATAVAAAARPAPRTQRDPATEAVSRAFTQVSGWLAQSAALVPPDKYSYRPIGTVRTFGELVAHVADSYNYYCGRAAGKNVDWSDAIEKGAKDKATVSQKLRQAGDVCAAAYGGTAQIGPLVENVGHTNLHYGNVITYLRMLGLTPPSS